MIANGPNTFCDNYAHFLCVCSVHVGKSQRLISDDIYIIQVNINETKKHIHLLSDILQVRKHFKIYFGRKVAIPLFLYSFMHSFLYIANADHLNLHLRFSFKGKNVFYLNFSKIINRSLSKYYSLPHRNQICT